MLLEQFDHDPTAIIEPEMVAPPLVDFPEIAISCFSKRLLEKAMDQLFDHPGEVICRLDTEDGGVPVTRVFYKGGAVALYLSRVGAPACAIQMEEMIGRGAKKFVFFGSCGVLDATYDKWHIIIPTAALRDEGVSYHYLPVAEEVVMGAAGVAAVTRVLDLWGKEYGVGKVWTTDALYRETVRKTQARKDAGCIAVDMECAAIHAVAQFRKVEVAQFFYAEDHLDQEVWNSRGLSRGVHTKAAELLELALESGRYL